MMLRIINPYKLNTLEFTGPDHSVYELYRPLTLHQENIMLNLRIKDSSAMVRKSLRKSLRELADNDGWKAGSQSITEYLDAVYNNLQTEIRNLPDKSLTNENLPKLSHQLEWLNPYFYHHVDQTTVTPKAIRSTLLNALEEDRKYWRRVVIVQPDNPTAWPLKIRRSEILPNHFYDSIYDMYFSLKNSVQEEIDLSIPVQMIATTYCNSFFQSFIDKKLVGQGGDKDITGGVSAWISEENVELEIVLSNGKVTVFIPFEALKFWGENESDYSLHICFEIFPVSFDLKPATELKNAKEAKDCFSEIKHGLDKFFTEERIPMHIQGIWAPFPIFRNIDELEAWLTENLCDGKDPTQCLQKLVGGLNNPEEFFQKVDEKGTRSIIAKKLEDDLVNQIHQFNLQTCQALTILVKMLEKFITKPDVFGNNLKQRVKEDFRSNTSLTPSIANSWLKLLDSINADDAFDIVKIIMLNHVATIVKDSKDHHSSRIAQQWIKFIKSLIEKSGFKGVRTAPEFLNVCLDTLRPIEDVEGAASVSVAEECLDFIADLSEHINRADQLKVFNSLNILKLPNDRSLCNLPEFRKAAFACFHKGTQERDAKINKCLMSAFDKVLSNIELLRNWVDARDGLGVIGVKIDR